MVTETDGRFIVTVTLINDADWDSFATAQNQIPQHLERLLQSFGSLYKFEQDARSLHQADQVSIP